MTKSFQDYMGHSAFAFSLFLGSALAFTSCADDDMGGKNAKGVEFTLTTAPWGQEETHSGGPARIKALDEPKVINISPEVSACVSVSRDDTPTTPHAPGLRAAAPAQPLPAGGNYTVVAYQGTAASPVKVAEMQVVWNGTTFTHGGTQAKMHLNPGTYTFVCYNDRLEEKNGQLVMKTYDRNKSITTEQQRADYFDSMASDYDGALVAKAENVVVTGNVMKVPFRLSHPWARVKFQIEGVGLKGVPNDTYYTSGGVEKTISYDADLSRLASMAATSATLPQQLSTHELNPMTLRPVEYSASDVDISTGTEKLNNQRALKFGTIASMPFAQRSYQGVYAYLPSYQFTETSMQYFPAGANLQAYNWSATPVSFYAKNTTYEQLYNGIRSTLPTSLAANGSYTVKIFVSYNFKYLFNDGTVGTLAENNNWRTKQPIGIVVSMKTKTAVGLQSAASAFDNTFDKNNLSHHLNKHVYSRTANDMSKDLSGYRNTYDPAYSRDGVTPNYQNANLPAFKIAANYNGGGANITAGWLKTPSTNLNDSIGKWYLPSYAEMVTFYKNLGHGGFVDINTKQKIPFTYGKHHDWRYHLLFDIGFVQGFGYNVPPTYYPIWTSTEITRNDPREPFLTQMYITDRKSLFPNQNTRTHVNDNPLQSTVLPFIHFK